MSLDLDERQRAMLEEMHVRVWWPQPGAPAPATDTRPGASARLEPAEALAGKDRPSPHGQMSAPAQAGRPPPAPAPLPDGVGPQLLVLDRLDWPALAATIAGCTACTLCIGRKAPVFAAEPVPRQVDWLVVGEPPDEQEERAGAPFAGQVGQLLDNMLRAVQLTRTGTGSAGARLTNVVKCRTAPVRNPQADELSRCAAYLRREIALVQPKVILAMGRFAALSLLSESSPELANLPFGKLRGHVHRFHGVPVVVTYHPSRLLRAREDKAHAWADLCLAQTLARQGPPSAG